MRRTKDNTMSWEKGLNQYQQIGNAVPVLMAKAIAECVIKFKSAMVRRGQEIE